jgi:hypothetical protein
MFQNTCIRKRTNINEVHDEKESKWFRQGWEGRLLGRPKMLGEDNIKMDCWGNGYDGR